MIFILTIMAMLWFVRRDPVSAVLASMASIYMLMLIGLTFQQLMLILVLLNFGLASNARNRILTTVVGGRTSKFIYLVIAASLVVVILGLYRVDMLWDEYGHWGYSIRYLSEVGHLPNASLPPAGHGAPWYPWGMAIYSVAVSFPFNSLALNAPVVVNMVLILLLATKLSNVLKLRGDQRAISITLVTVLLGWQHSALLFSGYTDPSLSLACLLAFVYFHELLKNDLGIEDWVGFGASLILVVSLKESGQYLAIVVLASTLPLIYYYRDKVWCNNFVLRFVLVMAMASSLVWIWDLNVATYSASSGREMGLWFSSNVAVSGDFFRAALSNFISHPSLYQSTIMLSSIALLGSIFKIGYERRTFDKPMMSSLIILCLGNLLFVIAAYYITFGTGEFRNAASFERYIELSSSAAMIAAYFWAWPILKVVSTKRWIKMAVTAVMIVSVYGWYSKNKHLFVAPDPQIEVVASELEELLPDDEAPYYLDYVGWGRYPIMLNWYFDKPTQLHYGVPSSGSVYEVPEGVFAIPYVRSFVFIEHNNRKQCYQMTFNMQELNDEAMDGVFYVFGPLSQLSDLINGRVC